MTRTIAVTGSASGMGFAVSANLQKAGNKVIGIDISDGADIVADLSTPEGRRAAVAGVKQRCAASLHGVVCCAGLSPSGRNAISRLGEVNYFGVVDLLDGLFDTLRQSESPAAVVIASMAAVRAPLNDPYVLALLDHNEAKATQIIDENGHPGMAYALSKAAVVLAVRRRAMAWGQAGVRINAIAPGNINTPMLQRELGDPIVGGHIREMPCPLGRFGEPEEIASTVAFLLSPEASYIHGVCLLVDGGIDAVHWRPNSF